MARLKCSVSWPSWAIASYLRWHPAAHLWPASCRLVDLAAPPVAMAPALLLSGFSPGCHNREAIAQAATLDLGWKPQDREQLVHQLTQAVRYLLEPFRIPCAQEGEPRTQIPTGDTAVLLGQRLKEPKLWPLRLPSPTRLAGGAGSTNSGPQPGKSWPVGAAPSVP